MSAADGLRTDQVRDLVAAEEEKKRPALVCPNGCGLRYDPIHESDEVGHACPKAPISKRLVWLKPEEVR